MMKNLFCAFALLPPLLIFIGCNTTTPNVVQELSEGTSPLTDLLCRTSDEFLHALKTYQPGQTIRLFPGTYRLSDTVLLKESVTIVGEKTDSEDEKIIIQGCITKDEPRIPLFQVETEDVVFTNLTINNIVDKTLSSYSRVEGIKSGNPFTINLMSGSATFANCLIDAGDAFGIGVSKDTQLTMEYCVLKNCSTALIVENFASAFLTNCDILHVHCGIFFRSGVNSRIRACLY